MYKYKYKYKYKYNRNRSIRGEVQGRLGDVQYDHGGWTERRCYFLGVCIPRNTE
jgi:hypothetical protein